QSENPYLALLEGVIERQADLIAHWMQFGFIHGVMNTDNMTVSGETIDFGPCAFLDVYDPAKKFSSIDHQGRYAFSNQGPIGLWNLTRFAETLLPLLDDDSQKAVELAEASLHRFFDLQQNSLERRLTAKIGLSGGRAEDWEMAKALLAAMADGEADFTLVFRHLSDALESGNDDTVTRLFNCPVEITGWIDRWRARLVDADRGEALALMRRSNPVIIPRNHRIEEAIQAAYAGEFAPFHRLNDALQRPFDSRPEFAEYEAAPAPDEVVKATFCGT
ncbi:MAG: YdiU family protein, partial [Planctomycetaceae bacterium]|nr:YdiU family protein [Planctomycetaceae bacterium]